MAQQSTFEFVNTAVQQFAAGDTTALAAVHPDIRVKDYPTFPDAQWHHGIEGMGAFAGKVWEFMGAIEVELNDPIETPPFVVFDWHAQATGKRGGVPISIDGSAVVQLREGKVFSIELFLTSAQARAAAGLTESG